LFIGCSFCIWRVCLRRLHTANIGCAGFFQALLMGRILAKSASLLLLQKHLLNFHPMVALRSR
jgi:hypothetical protein